MPYFKNNNLNLLFIHIPKTGGTSLERYLSIKHGIPLNTKSLYSSSTNGYNNVSLQHQKYNTLLNKNENFGVDFNNIKIISIVRNPYERIVSDLFFFNLIDNTTLKKHVYRILKKYVDSNNYDNHNIPQYSFLIDDSNKINKDIIVFKTETLTNDLIKYGFTDFNKNENVNNIKNVNYFEFLNKKSVNLINNFYKKDFELFDYPFITK